jgi:hypothetical protein
MNISVILWDSLAEHRPSWGLCLQKRAKHRKAQTKALPGVGLEPTPRSQRIQGLEVAIPVLSGPRPRTSQTSVIVLFLVFSLSTLADSYTVGHIVQVWPLKSCIPWFGVCLYFYFCLYNVWLTRPEESYRVSVRVWSRNPEKGSQRSILDYKRLWMNGVWLQIGRPGDRGSIPGRGKGFFL